MSAPAYIFFPNIYYYGQYSGTNFTSDASTYLNNNFGIDTTSIPTESHYFVLGYTPGSTPTVLLLEFYNSDVAYLTSGTAGIINGGGCVFVVTTTQEMLFVNGVTPSHSGGSDGSVTQYSLFTFTNPSFSLPTIDFIPSTTSTAIATTYQSIYGNGDSTGLVVIGSVTDNTNLNGGIVYQSTTSATTTIYNLLSYVNFTSAFSNASKVNYVAHDSSSNIYLFTNGFSSSSTYDYSQSTYNQAYFITMPSSTAVTSASITSALSTAYPNYTPTDGDFVFINNGYALLYSYDDSISAWALATSSLPYQTSRLFDVGSQKAYMLVASGSASTGTPVVDNTYIDGSQIQYTDVTAYYYSGAEIDTVTYTNSTGALTTTLGGNPVTVIVPIGGILACMPATYNSASTTSVLLFQQTSAAVWQYLNIAASASIRDMRGNSIYIYQYNTVSSYLSCNKLTEAVIDSYLENGFSTGSNGTNLFSSSTRFIPVCLDGQSGYYSNFNQPPGGSELLGSVPDSSDFAGTAQNFITVNNSGTWIVNTAVVSDTAPAVAQFTYTDDGVTYTFIYYFYMNPANVYPLGSYSFTTVGNNNSNYLGTSYISTYPSTVSADTSASYPHPLYGGTSKGNFVTFTQQLAGSSTFFTLNGGQPEVVTLNSGYAGVYNVSVNISYSYQNPINVSGFSSLPKPFFYFAVSPSSDASYNAISYIPTFAFTTASTTTYAVQASATVNLNSQVTMGAGDTLAIFYHPNSVTDNIAIGESITSTGGTTYTTYSQLNLSRVST